MPQFIQKQMKIRVRFEDGTQRADAEEFLKSLGLDLERWLEEQTFDTEGRGPAKIFGMSLPVDSEELAGAETWICSIYEQEGSKRLEINGELLAAKIYGFQKALLTLPKSLTRLSLFALRLSKIEVAFSEELPALTTLNLGSCMELTDLSFLSGLSQLKWLNLKDCWMLNDLSFLSGLSKLEWLNLDSCRQLTDLRSLCGLKNLTHLHMGSCSGVIDLSFLSGLSQLRLLYLDHCSSAVGLNVLSCLSQLQSLDLSFWNSLTDLSDLSELSQLKVLVLNGCRSLADLSVLSRLSQLRVLHLASCQSLTNFSFLSSLSQLRVLNLHNCNSIRNLNFISSLLMLEKLTISGLERLRSIELLREMSALRDLQSNFHPAVVAELLAHAAVMRTDKRQIAIRAMDWLSETVAFTDGEVSEQERFAATLGEAFSLLGKHAIELPYEAYLQSKPDFSSAPWKAWLEGTGRQSGSELMRRRIERQDIALSTPGCIGGISAVMPDQSSSDEDQAWGRDWLAEMEAAWQTRSKELLPVSAEVCLAYARLGLKQALDCWLERFTDPSDPAALDPVQAALGQWQLDHGQIESAIEHAVAVQQPATRDPLLAAIVEASYLLAASRAGEVLLMIESEGLRGELAVRLVQEAAFAASAVNMERLIVACGHSVEALAQLINQAAPEADAAHLQALSEKLKQSPQATKDLQRTLSLKLLSELSI